MATSIIIAICDDEPTTCSELEAHLIKELKKFDIKHDVDVHYTNKSLFRQMDEGTRYDLIFLDIEFANDEINGVEVARRIREVMKNDSVGIIFISWETKHNLELFDKRPLNFFKKPFDYPKITQTLEKYLELSRLRHYQFTYKKGHTHYRVDLKDIKYLESDDNKLIIHFGNRKSDTFYGSINKEFDKQLKGHDFIRIHMSYAINFDYILNYKRKEILLKDMDFPLQVSQDKQTSVKKEYMEIALRRDR